MNRTNMAQWALTVSSPSRNKLHYTLEQKKQKRIHTKRKQNIKCIKLYEYETKNITEKQRYAW